jgi:N utilization substance protein B
MAGASSRDIEAEFRTDYDFSVVDLEYLPGPAARCRRDAAADLDGLYESLLDRRIDDLDPVERCLLRMGCFELRERIDVPYRVVINEAVALAKKFGAADSYRYVNGILDKVARELRGAEVSAAS